MNYKEILIAIDGSECSMKAAKKGIELAEDISADVLLLSVVDMTSMVDSAAVGAIVDKDIETIYRDEAMKLLNTVKDKYPYPKIRFLAEEGVPSEAINTIAEKNKVDLIVMGTHGRTGIDHFFMGSVAEHVLRHSKIPVMIVASAK